FRSTGQCTLIYEIVEYNPLLDSSNMSCKEWNRIAKDIVSNYNKFDGFVVVHGTDTMAYTSSALSFMLEGLGKPVVITGSQIPIFETRSDAKDNFLSSLIIAGSYDIPEVCVFFANKLFRGNRTAKISSYEFDAFDSPNYHTLADVGIDVKKSYLTPPTQGLVIQSYGTGNLPSNRLDILRVLKDAVERNILIINITQCTRGAVCSSYECGKIVSWFQDCFGKKLQAVIS
ncbi:hypothetical protein NQ314_011055, partial [Rhamnusium bicolor]